MIGYRQTLLVFLLMMLSGATIAQNNTNSPYTRYGYGQLADQGSGNSKAMGGVVAKLVRPQDAGGNQVENIFLSIGNYSMAGVVAALAACHHVGGFRQEIDHFALAFVAPLGADHNGIHDKNGTRRP